MSFIPYSQRKAIVGYLPPAQRSAGDDKSNSCGVCVQARADTSSMGLPALSCGGTGAGGMFVQAGGVCNQFRSKGV